MKKLKKEDLSFLFTALRDSHRIIGPKIESGVIVLGEIDLHDIPAGFEDHQKAGSYRLVKGERPETFSFSPGPDSFKRFLHPPVSEMFTFRNSRTGSNHNTSWTRRKSLLHLSASGRAILRR